MKTHSIRRGCALIFLFVVMVFCLINFPRSIARWLIYISATPAMVWLAYKLLQKVYEFITLIRATNREFAAHTIPATSADLESLSRPRMILEISVIILIALSVTTQYWQPDHDTQLAGREAQWLTGSAYVTAYSLADYGYIPLWHPYNGKGEPLIDNPFSFIFNPFSILPTLLTGQPEQGIKTSVAIAAILASLGGWFLAYMLNMRFPARMLLAAMFLGKGNMVSMIGMGYFQLGVQQAYMPWIVGATIAYIRLPNARWPAILLALSFALQFWAGNVWYSLPTLIIVIMIVFFWRYDVLDRLAWKTRLRTIGRFAVIGAVTIALTAVTLFPIFAKQEYIGGHKSLPDGGETMPTDLVIRQFFETNLNSFTLNKNIPGFLSHFYYSFVATRWYLILILLVFLPIYPLTWRNNLAGSRRLFLLLLCLMVVFTVWGIGGLQPFRWIYNNLPGIGQWRFVGRALGAASFCMAILIALRVDGLWTAITNADKQPYHLPNIVRFPVAGGLLLATVFAIQTSARIWDNWDGDGVAPKENVYDICAQWLREQYPNEPLTVYQVGYLSAGSFYRQRIRLFPIEADYFPVPIAYAEGINLVWRAYPSFAIPRRTDDRGFAIVIADYKLLLGDSPINTEQNAPCALEKKDALPYSFSLPMIHVKGLPNVPQKVFHEIQLVQTLPDQIVVQVAPSPDQELGVFVSEVAYPGWRTWVNGQPAEITSDGGYLSVHIPPGDPTETVTIRFRYLPGWFVFGAGVTLITCILVIGYLLRLDRFFFRRRSGIRMDE